MMFTRYAFAVNPSALLSITCAVMHSGYCCGWTPSHVSDTLEPLVMLSKELVKSPLAKPAVTTKAEASPLSLMAVVVCVLVAGKPGGVAWCSRRGRGTEGRVVQDSRDVPRRRSFSRPVSV